MSYAALRRGYSLSRRPRAARLRHPSAGSLRPLLMVRGGKFCTQDLNLAFRLGRLPTASRAMVSLAARS
jgi:hypothetical protein